MPYILVWLKIIFPYFSEIYLFFIKYKSNFTAIRPINLYLWIFRGMGHDRRIDINNFGLFWLVDFRLHKYGLNGEAASGLACYRNFYGQWIIDHRCDKSVTNRLLCIRNIGGGGRIRTDGGLSPSLVFKTSAFNHSATPPKGMNLTLIKGCSESS